MDLEVQTGANWTRMWLFLMDLSEHKAILGYSWFTAVQPKIDWKCRWIDESHLPIILRTDNTGKAKYLSRMINIPQPIHKVQYYLGKVTIGSVTQEELKGGPKEYSDSQKCPNVWYFWLFD
jgi:hypothetical protein